MDAASRFTAAIDLDTAVTAYLSLGDVRRAQGDDAGAAEIWERAVDVSPARAHLPLERLESLYVSQGRRERFVALCERLTAAAPREWRARAALARHLVSQGSPTQALELLFGALEHNPHAIAIHQAIWAQLSQLSLPQPLVARYIDTTRQSVFYLDPHVCTRCRYRSAGLLGSKRKVRHDVADIFCTSVVGERGQRAKDWRLVADIAKPAAFAQKVQERALQLAQSSTRPAGAKGVELTPLERTIEADALRYRHVTVEIDRAKRTASLTVKAPTGPQPTDVAGIEAAGAAWYPLAMARELDDAILSMRGNEPEIGTWLIKTEGEAAAVLAMDATLEAHADHWLVRETIGLLRRTFSRIDMSSRSLFALIEPGSCFAGSFLGLSPACDRSYHLALPDDEARAPKITVGAANFGRYPMATGQSRLGRRFSDEAPALASPSALPCAWWAGTVPRS